MKKLFSLLTLITIFLFGCQSESPVAPSENNGSVTSLQKPSLNFSAVKSGDGDYVICTWNSIGGTNSYDIYFKEKDDYTFTYRTTVSAIHGQKSYEKDIDISGWTTGTYYFKLAAISHHGTTKTSQGSGSIDIP